MTKQESYSKGSRRCPQITDSQANSEVIRDQGPDSPLEIRDHRSDPIAIASSNANGIPSKSEGNKITSFPNPYSPTDRCRRPLRPIPRHMRRIVRAGSAYTQRGVRQSGTGSRNSQGQLGASAPVASPARAR